MNRRAATRAVTVLLLALLVAAVPIATSDVTFATAPPADDRDFIPEDRDLTECIGALERPGCGSEERGGWRQTAVFGVMLAGMAFVGWRIVAGARRQRTDTS